MKNSLVRGVFMKVNDVVMVDNPLYDYKIPWLQKGIVGTIIEELPTNNKRNVKRFLVVFPCCGSAKLYEDELRYPIYSIKKEDFCNEECCVMNEKNKICERFYNISKKNIENRYDEQVQKIKLSDPVYKLVNSTIKELSDLIGCKEDDIEFSLIQNDTVSDEFLSNDTHKKLEQLEFDKQKEISYLASICSNAEAVISYTQTFEELISTLADHNIVEYNNQINTDFGKEPIIDFDDDEV